MEEGAAGGVTFVLLPPFSCRPSTRWRRASASALRMAPGDPASPPRWGAGASPMKVERRFIAGGLKRGFDSPFFFSVPSVASRPAGGTQDPTRGSPFQRFCTTLVSRCRGALHQKGWPLTGRPAATRHTDELTDIGPGKQECARNVQGAAKEDSTYQIHPRWKVRWCEESPHGQDAKEHGAAGEERPHHGDEVAADRQRRHHSRKRDDADV